MTYTEFNIFFKYCYNQVDRKFLEYAVRDCYRTDDQGYIQEQWNAFQQNMFSYIAQRKEIFTYLQNQMEIDNYQG